MAISSSNTPFDTKVKILSDFYYHHRDDKQFKDFFEYNDLGLPLAYFVTEELAYLSNEGEIYIDETFNLLLEALGHEDDTGFESLDEILDI